MKITELLNAQPTRAPVPRVHEEYVAQAIAGLYGDARSKPAAPATFSRKMDMASLDLYAQRQRLELKNSSHDAVEVKKMPPISGLLQRSLQHFGDLVPPPQDEAMETKAPTPLETTSSNEDDEPVASMRGSQRGRRAHKASATSAADTLAALAQAAVASVADEQEQTPETKPKPKRGAGGGRPAPLTEDEKRAKQRLLVKKSYYRKIDTLNTLRETVTQLEKEYADVVEAAQENKSQVMQQQLKRHSILALVDSSNPETEMMNSFQEMAVSIDHLRRENESLRAVAMEQSKARTRVGILVQEEFQDQNKRGAQYSALLQNFPVKLRSPEEEAAVERAQGASLAPGNAGATEFPSPQKTPGTKRGGKNAPLIHMTPMTEDECIEVVRDAYGDIMQFRTSSNVVTSGGRVFGWKDRRRISGDYVQFALEKTFHFRTAEQLAMNTWRVLSTERGINRIYSSSIRATFHFVQQVSEHNVVFYRTMERVGQNVLLKSLILASFVQTETGYMVLFRSIDPHKRNVRDAVPPLPGLPGGASSVSGTGASGDKPLGTMPDRKEIWIDMFSWGVFEAAGENGEHCTDFFGGFVPSTIATSSSFWMMEVLLIAVRCESECAGPLFLLPQENDDENEDVKREACVQTTLLRPEQDEDVAM